MNGAVPGCGSHGFLTLLLCRFRRCPLPRSPPLPCPAASGGRERGACPGHELVRIVVEAVWHAPVGGERGAFAAAGIAEGLEPLAVEVGCALLVNLQIDHAGADQGEHGFVSIDPGAAKQTTHFDRSERAEQLADILGRHQRMSRKSGHRFSDKDMRNTRKRPRRTRYGCAEVSGAGLSCTDSPQPQAETWFGLLKTKVEEKRSVLKSSSVPSRNSTALALSLIHI